MKTRQITFTLTIIVILSLLLSACGFAFGAAEAVEEQENNTARTGEAASSDLAGEPTPLEESEEIMPQVEMEAPAGLPDAEFAPESDEYLEKGGGGQGITQPLPTAMAREAPDDMFFEDYGVNPFLDTEDDQLSTFSMDMDTGSFTLTRSYLMDGYLPPIDAVRVEEFVNYFQQGYPNPSQRDTFGVYIDGAPSPFTQTERYQMMRVGIQAYEVSVADRKPASLTFVIDVSGSMQEGGRLELVKDSLELLVEQLDRSDQVGIVAYSDTAWVVLDPTPASKSDRILRAIRSLYPTASTNAEAGLVLGYDMAAHAYMPGAVNRVVLCSDGVANVGATGPGSIWERIKYQASEGITLTTVGVGMGNYNDLLLEQLADNGEGFYAYIDTQQEAERLFLRDLVSTLQVVAMDAKVQVDFNPDVVSRYRLVGYENREIADEDFRNDRVDAAEIGAGHSVTALYEIKLHSGTRGEIATVHLRWQDPDTGRAHETAEMFYTDELGRDFYDADPHLQLDIIVAEFAEELRDSYWADSSFSEILGYTHSLTPLLEAPEVADLIEMIERASWLAYE